ncbi:ATP-binding protein [Streptomyces telluris]|uniref:ATP-binding protein n=1 Tax=Streptomyces telluris TaxID=2720021 RepID=A0A9X2LKY3_9ACTN|nr:ATP-binding protein [Streptomyces telluris]MCQ8773093.1 ATP-binding protein [Streptomyces telluris]NJP81845.1 ATP-binding protein [Streptomyces telluris]
MRIESRGVAPCRKAIGQARRAVRCTLARWAVEPDIGFDTELVLSELLANALQHATPAGEEIGLSVTEAGGTVLVEVEDGGTGGAAALPSPTCPDDDAQHGRGLLLVESLALWGWRTLDNGHRIVWAMLTPSPASSNGSRA